MSACCRNLFSGAACRLDIAGAEAIAEGLRHNAALRVLNVARNGVRARGCIALADGLLQNEALQELDLSSNAITSTACLSIARLLALNATLRVLALRRNPVGECGAQVVLQAAGRSAALRKLDFEGANLSVRGDGSDSAVQFNPLNPNGAYRLDLSGAALAFRTRARLPAVWMYAIAWAPA
jgi:Ran GTPase-activating protein (RanGAP) involved in mRNA processing and transport